MRSDARKRDDGLPIVISAVEWAQALAEAWEKGRSFVETTQCDNCYSCGYADPADNPYGTS